MMRKLLIVSFLILILSGCSKPIPVAQDITEIDASKDPIQDKNITSEPIDISGNNYSFTLKLLASYKISGLVKSRKKYSNDWNSVLSPMDVVLVWGKLAELTMDEFIKYWQRNRWYYYEYKAGTPVSKDYIISHSSNNHLIPATENIKSALNLIDVGKKICIEGYLVYITAKYKGTDHWWNSSLSRKDSGNGSCEVIYVKKINIEGQIFE